MACTPRSACIRRAPSPALIHWRGVRAHFFIAAHVHLRGRTIGWLRRSARWCGHGIERARPAGLSLACAVARRNLAAGVLGVRVYKKAARYAR